MFRIRTILDFCTNSRKNCQKLEPMNGHVTYSSCFVHNHSSANTEKEWSCSRNPEVDWSWKFIIDLDKMGSSDICPIFINSDGKKGPFCNVKLCAGLLRNGLVFWNFIGPVFLECHIRQLISVPLAWNVGL